MSTEDLRYPIGRFDGAAASDAASRARQIAVLRELAERLGAAVAGLDEEQLNTPYREGGWTARQVVHHLADSHANAYVRLKLALTEEWPAVKPYDEAAWAELADSRLPLAVSLDLIAALHTRWVVLLEAMTEAQFERGFVHPVLGHVQLDRMLALYAWHSLHHTAHIAALRARRGW